MKSAEERVKEARNMLIQEAWDKGRAEALEEACAIVNKKMCGHQMDIVEKIRALKGKS